MDELSLTDSEHLIEQIQESLDQVLHMRVIIANNSIEIYTSFEHIRAALIQVSNYDPHFVNIMVTSENESGDLMMETLVREIDELIMEFSELN